VLQRSSASSRVDDRRRGEKRACKTGTALLSLAVLVVSAACSPAQTAASPSASATAGVAGTCEPRVGVRETVLTTQQRSTLYLANWPDGTMGVLKDGPRYSFIASNAGQPSVALGTLQHPAAYGVRTGIQIQNPKDRYDYAAGGPLYRDKASGMWLLFYHAEKWPGGDSGRFYSLIGLARSSDAGSTWQDLGPIVSPEVPFGSIPAEIASGAYAVVGPYFYVYFRDVPPSGAQINLAVARARAEDVLKAAASGRTVAWAKYYLGSWVEPGLGGRSSPLVRDNPTVNWLDVSYNSDLRRYLIVAASWVGPGPRDLALYILSSADGLKWGAWRVIAGEPGENFYPTIVGLGDDPHITGKRFYVYYMYSARGPNLWADGVLMRRLISCA
jgi:hypothetical protein